MERERLWELVRQIPVGSVASYGDVGAAMTPVLTGRQVGRLMASCPEGVPWWRVVARDGTFPIGKRDPWMQLEQRELLAREGVHLEGDRVDMSRHRYLP